MLLVDNGTGDGAPPLDMRKPLVVRLSTKTRCTPRSSVAVPPFRAAVVTSDSPLRRRADPPASPRDRLGLTQARSESPGHARAGPPAQSRNLHRSRCRVRHLDDHRMALRRRDRGVTGGQGISTVSRACSPPPKAATNRNRRSRPTAPTRNCVAAVNAQFESWKVLRKPLLPAPGRTTRQSHSRLFLRGKIYFRKHHRLDLRQRHPLSSNCCRIYNSAH